MKSEEQILRDFYAGTGSDVYQCLGCHRTDAGYRFRVWAPNAVSVHLIGDFNNWDHTSHPMSREGSLWTVTVPEAKEFDAYKYVIEGPNGRKTDKSDPFGFHAETRPYNASKIYSIDGYTWHDGLYLARRASQDPLLRPVNIYEVHLGSWRQTKAGEFYSYSRLADELIPYVKEMGYTHIELLPVTEYPLDASWGYQVIGFFAPTSRYGTPKDFMAFVDRCHRAGIGVILDWVGAHFSKDSWGLADFDGTSCFESGDPTKRERPEWGTRAFDYGRPEVRSFLISSVCYWLREYHIDGIRADAVASMIYLDYGRREGEWHLSENGDNIDRSAVSLLQAVNRAAFAVNPRALMIAEESSAFPGVTRPDYEGGLGFNLKWNMGWMHDTLDYISADPLARKWCHDKITFSMTYAFAENFVLPISHDEVVCGKRSVMGRVPGNYEQKFAGLRLLYAYMIAHPGKKLSFMGNEFGQFIEWDFSKGLDWLLLGFDSHRNLQRFLRDLNCLYREQKPLWQNDRNWDGFQWVKVNDRDESVFAFRRIDHDGREILCVFNFTPVERVDHRIGLPFRATLMPLLSSDDRIYGGDGTLLSSVTTENIPFDGQPYSAGLHLPPLSAAFYRIRKQTRKASAKTKVPVKK